MDGGNRGGRPRHFPDRLPIVDTHIEPEGACLECGSGETDGLGEDRTETLRRLSPLLSEGCGLQEDQVPAM